MGFTWKLVRDLGQGLALEGERERAKLKLKEEHNKKIVIH